MVGQDLSPWFLSRAHRTSSNFTFAPIPYDSLPFVVRSVLFVWTQISYARMKLEEAIPL